jgi:hypothetical protein
MLVGRRFGTGPPTRPGRRSLSSGAEPAAVLMCGAVMCLHSCWSGAASQRRAGELFLRWGAAVTTGRPTSEPRWVDPILWRPPRPLARRERGGRRPLPSERELASRGQVAPAKRRQLSAIASGAAGSLSASNASRRRVGPILRPARVRRETRPRDQPCAHVALHPKGVFAHTHPRNRVRHRGWHPGGLLIPRWDCGRRSNGRPATHTAAGHPGRCSRGGSDDGDPCR